MSCLNSSTLGDFNLAVEVGILYSYSTAYSHLGTAGGSFCLPLLICLASFQLILTLQVGSHGNLLASFDFFVFAYIDIGIAGGVFDTHSTSCHKWQIGVLFLAVFVLLFLHSRGHGGLYHHGAGGSGLIGYSSCQGYRAIFCFNGSGGTTGIFQHDSCIVVHIFYSHSCSNGKLSCRIGVENGVGGLDIPLGNLHIRLNGHITAGSSEAAGLTHLGSGIVGKIAHHNRGPNIKILVPACCLSFGVLFLFLFRILAAVGFVLSILGLVSLRSALSILYGLRVAAGGRFFVICILVGSQDAAFLVFITAISLEKL